MGLVQSHAETVDDAVEVEGFFFTIDQSLQRFISVYGGLIVDFRQTFFGGGFMVGFTGQRSCG